MARESSQILDIFNLVQKTEVFPKKFVFGQTGRISLDLQSGRIPQKSEEMTGKTGLAREGTVRQGEKLAQTR